MTKLRLFRQRICSFDSVNTGNISPLQQFLNDSTTPLSIRDFPVVAKAQIQLTCSITNVSDAEGNGENHVTALCSAHTPTWQKNNFTVDFNFVIHPHFVSLSDTNLFSQLAKESMKGNIQQDTASIKLVGDSLSESDKAKTLETIGYIVGSLNANNALAIDTKRISSGKEHDPFYDELHIASILQPFQVSEKIVSIETLSKNHVLVKALYTAKAATWNQTDVANTFTFIRNSFGELAFSNTDLVFQLEQKLFDSWIHQNANSIVTEGSLNDVEKMDILRQVALFMISLNTYDHDTDAPALSSRGALPWVSTLDARTGGKSLQVQDKLDAIKVVSASGISVEGTFTAISTDPTGVVPSWTRTGKNSFTFGKNDGQWKISTQDLISQVDAIDLTQGQKHYEESFSRFFINIFVIFGLVILPLFIVFSLIGLLMIIDIIKSTLSQKEKVLWIMGILFFPLFGSVIYFFTARRKYRKQIAIHTDRQ